MSSGNNRLGRYRMPRLPKPDVVFDPMPEVTLIECALRSVELAYRLIQPGWGGVGFQIHARKGSRYLMWAMDTDNPEDMARYHETEGQVKNAVDEVVSVIPRADSLTGQDFIFLVHLDESGQETNYVAKEARRLGQQPTLGAWTKYDHVPSPGEVMGHERN